MSRQTQVIESEEVANKLSNALSYSDVPASRALEKIVSQLSDEDLISLLTVPSPLLKNPVGIADQIVLSVSSRLDAWLSQRISTIVNVEIRRALDNIIAGKK